MRDDVDVSSVVTPAFITGQVYLAGPMSGYPEFNAPAFRDAAASLRERGWKVISPVELDDESGFEHKGKAGTVGGPGAELSEAEYLGFLKRDLQRMLSFEDVQGVVVLPGWEKSRGAALEVHVARELGKLILAYPELTPVKRPTDYRPPSDESVLEEAERLVGGDRGSQYGPPSEDFERSAQIMSAILGVEVQPLQVPMLMIAVKLSRLVKSPQKRDSVVDIAGYAKTYEDAAEDLGKGLR